MQNLLEPKGDDSAHGQFLGHSRFDSDLSRGYEEDMMAQLEEHGKITGNFADLDNSIESINRPIQSNFPGLEAATIEHEKGSSYTQLPLFIRGGNQTRNNDFKQSVSNAQDICESVHEFVGQEDATKSFISSLPSIVLEFEFDVHYK